MSSKNKRGAARRAALPLAGLGSIALAARPPRPLKPLPMARQCGACSACCIVFQVGELDKLRGEPCHFLKEAPDERGMCSIWDAPIWTPHAHGEFAGKGDDGVVRKPPVCRDFKCAWLKGNVPEDLYPPKSGVVITDTSDGQKVQILELVKNAARSLAVDTYIDSVVARGVPVVVLPPVDVPGGEEPKRRYITASDKVFKLFEPNSAGAGKKQ